VEALYQFLCAHTRIFFVNDRGKNNVPAQIQFLCLRYRDHAGGQAPFHVVSSSSIQATFNNNWLVGMCHPSYTHGVHVTIEQQSSSSACSAGNSDYIGTT
jgi:hypothetical protein